MQKGEENEIKIISYCSIKTAGLVECVELIRRGACPLAKGVEGSHYRCVDVFKKISSVNQRRKIIHLLSKWIGQKYRFVINFLKK